MAPAKNELARPVLMAALMKSDLRTESSFNAGIAPAKGAALPTTLLILRNNVMYPLLQGFLWAVAKDWMAVASIWMNVRGNILGTQFRQWVQSIVYQFVKPATTVTIN